MEDKVEPVRTTQKRKEIAPCSRREATQEELEGAFYRAIKLFRELPEEDFVFPASVLTNELSEFYLDFNVLGAGYGKLARNAVFGCYFMGSLEEILEGLGFSLDNKPFRTIDFAGFVEVYGRMAAVRKGIKAVTGSLAGLEKDHQFKCHTALAYYLEGKFLDALETLDKKKISIYKKYIVDLHKSVSVNLQARFEGYLRTRMTQKAVEVRHKKSPQAKAKAFIKERFDKAYRGKNGNRHIYDGYANKEAFVIEMMSEIEKGKGMSLSDNRIRLHLTELERKFIYAT